MLPILSRLIFITFIVQVGCLSPRFQSSWSCDDPGYFCERPHIQQCGESYELQWKYGSLGFYFLPVSKVVNGQLLFALQATTSTGNRHGKIGSVPITNPRHVAALRNKGAFWLEPNGSKIPLKVVQP